jgi:hypothetical protein
MNTTRRRPLAAALVGGALLLCTGCPDDDLGEAPQDDPQQTVPAPSPAHDEGGQVGDAEGVGPSGGPPQDGGR